MGACSFRSKPIILPQRSESGIASYYGSLRNQSISKTASGEVFDPKQLTAAHKSLPFGSLLRVQNLKNKKSITVRVNDRGPFANDRIVDLSLAAATKLDMIKGGVAPVRITVIQ